MNNEFQINLNGQFTKLIYTLTTTKHTDTFEEPYCLSSIFLVIAGLVIAAIHQYKA